jgi:UDP-N-acetylmuramate--alanine ligase
MASGKIHFIGIGGGALNGLAQVMAARGWLVTGSDLRAEGPVIDRLREQGITVFSGHAATNVAADVNQVIISSAVVAGPGAVEVEAAEKLGIPIYKRTELWRRLSGGAKIAVAVAGSHGKTTTTAMIGHILAVAGLDPTVLVGGEVPDFGGTVRVGSPDVIVVEADEYDRAFHSLRPTLGVIVNVDYDHPDTYATPAAYEQGFRKFARAVRRRSGRLLLNGHDQFLRREFKHWRGGITWFDPTGAWPGVKLQVPGSHLAGNALAAGKVAHYLGVDSVTIKRALRSWRGVSRRFEPVGECSGLKVFDDFAHHPTEVAANIKTAREAWGQVAVLFQPHQGVRTERFATDFATVLKEADHVALLPIYRVAGREGDNQTTEAAIAQLLPQATVLAENAGAVADWCASLYKEGFRQLLAMGAGTVSALVREACHDE